MVRARTSRVACSPSNLRHPHVHQHDVGVQRDGLFHGLRAVRRLADDGDSVRIQDHPEPGSHQPLVVGDQHPDPARCAVECVSHRMSVSPR